MDHSDGMVERPGAHSGWFNALLFAAILSGQWGILAGAALACAAYYGAYE